MIAQSSGRSENGLWNTREQAAKRSADICRNISFARANRGQALAEGMVGLVALAVLFWAIPVLGRYQDIALQAAHASRYAAFLAAVGAADEEAVSGMANTAHFSGSGRRWRTVSGDALMPFVPEVSMQRVPDVMGMQPGAGHAAAAVLRREWQVGDDAMLQATVLARPLDVVSLGPAAPGFLGIARSTSILTGAGHAYGNEAVQQRVAQGAAGWATAAARSTSAGREVTARMQDVDKAWARPRPDFDWLGPWQALVPADRLVRQP